MAKKKASTAAAAKAAKKAKALKKVEKKETKAVKKGKGKAGDVEDDDQDLEGILAKLQKEWEESHAVTEETVEGPPSRRANATLTPCPNGNHLWCIGGEYFSEDGKAYFYNDVYRYAPDKDEWRRFASPTCPGPRSAHAVVGLPSGGGKLFLYGGEFSSLYQNSFHHYRDFWCFDIPTHSWERIETKVRPSARSGHRMAVWKHLIILFGGFYDPGIRTNYLQDLWIFDTQTYKWEQVQFKDLERKPSARSGFSFIPVPEGVILHGGYYKEYVKGKRAQGIALEDTWFLRMDADLKLIKWERRKKIGYAPTLRSGCTMAFWPARAMGVLFGGVYDNDRDEETMDSVFYNDLFGYQTVGNGRWVSLMLKRPKKKAGGGRKAAKPLPAVVQPSSPQDRDDVEMEDAMSDDEHDEPMQAPVQAPVTLPPMKEDDDIDPDDPERTRPLTRYNAMLAVLRNTLYVYGGSYESGSREYTLDDFHFLQLDKLDRFVCLRESSVAIGPEESSSESESGESEDGESDDEDAGNDVDMDGEPEVTAEAVVEVEVAEEEPTLSPEDLRTQATAFMGVSKDATRSPEDVISTPLPGESLAVFYARSRTYWAQKALNTTATDNRGKQLRRDGFQLAEERYNAYKPLLQEVEKILAEAGLDEEEIKRSAAGGPAGNTGQSRNRR